MDDNKSLLDLLREDPERYAQYKIALEKMGYTEGTYESTLLKGMIQKNNNDFNKIKQEIDKLNRKKIDATELFSIDEIDYETFKNIKEVVDSKISVLNKELELIDTKEEDVIETNEDLIKEIIVNLKSNFIKLNNHEKKIFLERFVKEIRVKKKGDEVMIESVVF